VIRCFAISIFGRESILVRVFLRGKAPILLFLLLVELRGWCFEMLGRVFMRVVLIRVYGAMNRMIFTLVFRFFYTCFSAFNYCTSIAFS
jgi:hypothetical protein